MSELKPCPFCGEKDKLTTYFSNTGSVVVYCINCYENNNGLSHDFDGWNTRPIEDELQRRIDELEAELAALREQVRWIPVSEKEPSDGVRYDVWLANNWQVKATYYNHTGMRYANPYWMNDCGVKISNVTHYKSLPQPPEGE